MQIFNDEVDSYKSWTLFLIFVSIVILISGVVLLTHKKPERTAPAPSARLGAVVHKSRHKAKRSDAKTFVDGEDGGGDEGAADDERYSFGMRQTARDAETGEELWAVGEESDGEDESHSGTRLPRTSTSMTKGEERLGLMIDGEEAARGLGRAPRESTLARRTSDPFRDDFEEFAGGGKRR